MKLFTIFYILASAYAVKFKDCGSDGITVKDVKITPCTKEPCELVHGQSYSIDINFEEQVIQNEWSDLLMYGRYLGSQSAVFVEF